MFDSSPLLLANDICENARSGVIAGGASFPRIERNLIAHNISAGLFFRDEALTKCLNNKVSLKRIRILTATEILLSHYHVC